MLQKTKGNSGYKMKNKNGYKNGSLKIMKNKLTKLINRSKLYSKYV